MNLEFLEEVCREKNLQFYYNTNNDLQLHDYNICFHLADLKSGEKDASKRWQYYYDNNIRCVFVYPPYLNNPNKVNIYKNILLYHCGFSSKIFARKTKVVIKQGKQLKQFFEENNIEGYRNSETAFCLVPKSVEDDKVQISDVLMCYTVGSAYFAKGSYQYELARGACKLGYQIVGGASKIWKSILDYYKDLICIVYYVDRREYDGRSIGHLMDSNDMKDLGKVYNIKGSKSFLNYWFKDVYWNDGRLWHRAGDYANREAHHNQAVQEAYKRGDVISVQNPGSYTNIFVRTGYHLVGQRVVKDGTDTPIEFNKAKTLTKISLEKTKQRIKDGVNHSFSSTVKTENTKTAKRSKISIKSKTKPVIISYDSPGQKKPIRLIKKISAGRDNIRWLCEIPNDPDLKQYSILLPRSVGNKGDVLDVNRDVLILV